MSRVISRVWLLLCASATLAGCAFPQADLRPYAELMQKARVDVRPQQLPLRSVSGFADAQACMDRMLGEANLGAVNIATKSLVDPTGKLGVNLKDMAITALLRMSRGSNTFRVVDFEAAVLQQDTVQNLTSILMPSGQMDIKRPQIYLSGGTSFNDNNILTRRRNIGLSGKSAGDGSAATEGDLGFSGDVNIGVIGLDLHLGDFTTRTLMPGIESSNEVIVATTGNGLDLGGRMRKYGFQFEISSNIGQGPGAAMRALVDLALIELVGKWARVPYWACLQIDGSSADLQRELWYWFEAMNVDERIKLGKRALRHLGYYGGEIDEVNGASFRRALGQWQSDNNLLPQGTMTFETYERLMTRFVERDESGRFTRIGWSGARPTLGENVLSASPTIAMALNKRGNTFVSGETIALRVSVSHSGFLRCYYQDSAGVIAQIFPNPQQPISLVEAGRAIMIPDTNRPNPLFSIEARLPGKQSSLCTLSTDDLQQALPAGLTGTGLTPIAGVTSMQTIVEAFSASKGRSPLGAAAVNWQVLARQEPAAESAVPGAATAGAIAGSP